MAGRTDRYGEGRTAFEKNRRIILATQNICGICGQPIEKEYKYPHPLSATVDHIIPVSKGGHPSDLGNLQAAHRYCNRLKADKLIIASHEKEKLSNNGQINNDDLPLHFDWANYKAL